MERNLERAARNADLVLKTVRVQPPKHAFVLDIALRLDEIGLRPVEMFAPSAVRPPLSLISRNPRDLISSRSFSISTFLTGRPSKPECRRRRQSTSDSTKARLTLSTSSDLRPLPGFLAAIFGRVALDLPDDAGGDRVAVRVAPDLHVFQPRDEDEACLAVLGQLQLGDDVVFRVAADGDLHVERAHERAVAARALRRRGRNDGR